MLPSNWCKTCVGAVCDQTLPSYNRKTNPNLNGQSSWNSRNPSQQNSAGWCLTCQGGVWICTQASPLLRGGGGSLCVTLTVKFTPEIYATLKPLRNPTSYFSPPSRGLQTTPPEPNFWHKKGTRPLFLFFFWMNNQVCIALYRVEGMVNSLTIKRGG